MKKILMSMFLVIGLLLITACIEDDTSLSKTAYFDGTVVVEYQTDSNDADYLAFQFYQRGIYDVSFSITPGKKVGEFWNNSPKDLPKNFVKTVKDAPREYIIQQRYFPNYFRITIKEGSQSEVHDF